MSILEPWSGYTAFVRTVDRGSFTAAARALGTTPSAVSRAVAKLERRLGVRLLQRNTRALSVTHDGAVLHERVSRLLLELGEVEAGLGSKRGLRGRLRVSAPMELGRAFVAGALRDFLEPHPALRVELNLTDRFVDLVEQRVDVAVRVGPLEPSSLIARKIGVATVVACAAPRYLGRAGVPRHPKDLTEHACLQYTAGGPPLRWHFRGPEGAIEVATRGPLVSDSGAALRLAAVEGCGVLRTLDVVVREELAEGRLSRILAGFEPEPLPVHAVFTPTRNLAPAVHAFVEHLARSWRQGPGN